MTSQTKVKRELRATNANRRSPFPRAAKHSKHAELQGFPNTREAAKVSQQSK